LNKIRLILCDALEKNEAVFLAKRGTEEIRNHGLETVAAFVEESRPCDAVCIDDRFFNRSSVLTDRLGRNVPIVCVLDFLRHLEIIGVISSASRRHAMHCL